MFPTTSQIINNYLPHVFGGGVLLMVALAMLIWMIKGRSSAAKDAQTDPRNWFFAVAVLVMLLVLVYFVAPPLVNAFRHRFDPQQISEIRVTKLGEAGTTDNKLPPSIVISDREQIAKGFQTLNSAPGYNLDRERFLPDGFGIDIKLVGAGDYSPLHLTAYRQSRKATAGATPVNVVAVQTSPEAPPMYFNSPAFHSWLRKNVDPLLSPPPPIYTR